MSDSEAIKEGI